MKRIVKSIVRTKCSFRFYRRTVDLTFEMKPIVFWYKSSFWYKFTKFAVSSRKYYSCSDPTLTAHSPYHVDESHIKSTDGVYLAFLCIIVKFK